MTTHGRGRHFVEAPCRDRYVDQIVALASGDRSIFREQVLDLLDRAIGYDKGSLQSFDAETGLDASIRGFEQRDAFARIPQYMSEFEPHELVEASDGRPVLDIEHLSAARRDRLSLYTDFLRPEQVTVCLTVMWRRGGEVSGVALTRTSAGATFSDAERLAISRLVPAIELGDSFVGLRGREARCPSSDAWADAIGLSKREREITGLVVRGLTNPEIAGVLGSSPNTVRNHLVSIYRKAGVGSRAELVFQATSFVAAERPRWVSHVGE